MIIGTLFLGKVKEINNQWIETKFVVIGVPLFPTSSMLVLSSGHNSRQGITIPLNRTSVIAGYSRIFTFIGAVALLAVGLVEGMTSLLLPGLLLGIAWGFLFFKYGKSTPAETEERNLLGKAIGLYALPDWLDFDTVMNNLKNLQFHYREKYNASDWKEDLQAPVVPAERKPVLYALALFNYMIDQSAESETLYTKARSVYR